MPNREGSTSRLSPTTKRDAETVGFQPMVRYPLERLLHCQAVIMGKALETLPQALSEIEIRSLRNPFCRQINVLVLDTLFGRPEDLQNIGTTTPKPSDTAS